MKIKYKLILGFVSVALLTWVVGYLAVQTSKRTLQKSIGDSTVSLAVNVMDSIDRSIHNRIEIFREYSWNSDLQKLVVESNAEFEQLDDIEAYIKEIDRQWSSAPEKEITPFMENIINEKISSELRGILKFYEHKYGIHIFGEVFVTNRYGANIAQTGKTTDYYQADEQWWQIAGAEGLYVQDVEYDTSSDVYSTDICIRIDDENGNFIGVIKVVLNIGEVINIIEEARDSAEYETVVFDLITRDGRIIYGTEGYEFLGDMPHNFLSHLEGEKHRDYFISESQEPGKGKELLAHVYSQGYRDYKGLGWHLVIGYETEEIFAPAIQLRNRIIIISFAVATLAVLMGLVISRAISNPLTELRNATIEFGLGNLDAHIKIRSNDEIGGLAASFNEMAGKLEESRLQLMRSHIQLEEKVEQRTAELSSVNAQLEGEVEQRTAAHAVLEERIKELKCLFSLSKLVERPDISLEQIFQETVYLIRNAYRYPDVTCVRITFNGCKYETDNFKKTELSQHAWINLSGQKAGDIEVYYLGENAEGGENPLLQEEHELIEAIAEHLGRIAERKKTGEKLQLFRNLIDRSNDDIFVIDPKWGRLLDVNGAACKELGYTREELLEMTVKDINDSFPNDASWTEYVKKIQSEGSVVLEMLSKRKDGTTFPVEINAKLIKQGGDEFIIAVSRDITERKKSEEALRKSEQKYRTLLENIPQKVFLKDDNLTYVSCNENYAGDLGIKPEEIAGRKDYEFYPKELADKYRADDRNVIKSGQRLEVDESYIQNGQEIIVHTVKTPVRDGHGNVSGVLGIFWDVTELKRAQQEIERLAKFPSEDPNPVLRVSKDGCILYANRGSKPLLNFWGSQVGEALPDQWRKFTEEVFMAGSSRNTELQCNSLTFSMTFAPIVDFGYVNVYALDITERKHAEKIQAHLFAEVEQANQELKDFAYIVSHDLKAPLRGIKTLADWISTDYAEKLDEDGREQLGLLVSRVDRMHNLIDGVLQYSRVGRIKEKHVKINLKELVPEIIDTLVPPENIEITVEDELPVVEFEETRIIQVFQNLLSNAVKYMDKPQGRITIGCVRENGFWKFNVADNGPGIEQQHFEKIFQIFQTLSPRDDVESTGVGLSVVKKIVEMYGGKIWLESKLGEGTTFFFTLPSQESEVCDDAKYKADIAR